MATKEQYEFFKFLYEEEERRAERIEKRATFYFTVISAFLGALLFTAEKVALATTLTILKTPVNIFTIILLAALALIVYGMFFRKHHRIVPAAELSLHPNSKEVDESVFFDQCIEQCVKATSDYQHKNEVAAFALTWGAVLLAAAIMLLLGEFALAPMPYRSPVPTL